MKASFALLVFAVAAYATPEFVGVVSSKDGVLFAVSLTPDRPPQWTRVGATIDGYHVVEYRSKEDVLVLKKGEEILLLKLKTAKVRDLPVGQSARDASPTAELLKTKEKAMAAEARIRELQAELAKLREAEAKSKK